MVTVIHMSLVNIAVKKGGGEIMTEAVLTDMVQRASGETRYSGMLGISQLETINQNALPAHSCFTVILHSGIKYQIARIFVLNMLLVLHNSVMDCGNMSFNE